MASRKIFLFALVVLAVVTLCVAGDLQSEEVMDNKQEYLNGPDYLPDNSNEKRSRLFVDHHSGVNLGEGLQLIGEWLWDTFG